MCRASAGSIQIKPAGSAALYKGLAGYPHFASLEIGPGAGVLLDRASVFTPSGAMLPAGRSDSFAERFAGTKAASLAPVALASKSSWVVQLIGDDTEATALSRFRQMQMGPCSLRRLRHALDRGMAVGTGELRLGSRRLPGSLR
jgi:hypothetical protein